MCFRSKKTTKDWKLPTFDIYLPHCYFSGNASKAQRFCSPAPISRAELIASDRMYRPWTLTIFERQ